MKQALTEEQANAILRASPVAALLSLRASALAAGFALLFLTLEWLMGLQPPVGWLAGMSASVSFVALTVMLFQRRQIQRAAVLRDMFNNHWRDVTATRDSMSKHRFYYFSKTEKAAGKTLSIQHEITLSGRELARFESHLGTTQP